MLAVEGAACVGEVRARHAELRRLCVCELRKVRNAACHIIGEGHRRVVAGNQHHAVEKLANAQCLAGEDVHQGVCLLHAGGLFGDHDGVVQVFHVFQRQDTGHDLHRTRGDAAVVRSLLIKHDRGVVRIDNDIVGRDNIRVRRRGLRGCCIRGGQKHHGGQENRESFYHGIGILV